MAMSSYAGKRMEVGIKLSIFVDGLVLLHEQNTIDR